MSEFTYPLLYAADAITGDEYIDNDMTVYRIAGCYNAMNPNHVVLSVHPASQPDQQVYREVPRSFPLGLRHNATTAAAGLPYKLHRHEVAQLWDNVHSRYGNQPWGQMTDRQRDGVFSFAASVLRHRMEAERNG